MSKFSHESVFKAFLDTLNLDKEKRENLTRNFCKFFNTLHKTHDYVEKHILLMLEDKELSSSQIRQKLSETIIVMPSVMYPVLDNLEKKGQIISWWGDEISSDGVNRYRMYALAKDDETRI